MSKKKKTPFNRLPIWPALFSGLLAPGTGQIMNGEFFKGIFLLLSSLGSGFWFSKVVTEQVALLTPVNPDAWAKDPTPLILALSKLTEKNPGMFVTFYLLVIVIWVYSVSDAYLTARNHLRLINSPPTKDETTDSLR